MRSLKNNLNISNYGGRKRVIRKMVKCPYCDAEFKKITTNHLKKHNVKYEEYLKEYENDKYSRLIIAEFILNYYSPDTDKYIEQVFNKKMKKYNWTTKYTIGNIFLEKKIESSQSRSIKLQRFNSRKGVRKFPFGKSDIINHLKNKTTIGIYNTNEESSFLTFDIDEDNLDYVERIYENLIRLGIEDDEILMSYSGNKGYHITLFFIKPIAKEELKKFFNLILQESSLFGIRRENQSEVVEPLGISSQAIKLPLSINRKNELDYTKICNWEDWEKRQSQGKGNFCYLINEYGCEIKTLEKIDSMKKINESKILKANNDFYEEFSCNKHNVQAFEMNEDEINASIESKLEKSIEAGERNKTLLEIAIYNKSKGMSAEDNERFLLNFSSNKKHCFTTSMKENIREISSMIKTIYFSDGADKYRTATCIKELTFNKNEILEILTIKDEALRKLYFVLFTHFKLYGNKTTNEFFMKYERIRDMLKIDGTTINKRLIALENLKKITFVRKGERDKDSSEYRNLANIYRLSYEIVNDENNEEYRLLCNMVEKKNNEISYLNFEMMCAKALTKNEIKAHFSKSDKILKYKYQKLQKIG